MNLIKQRTYQKTNLIMLKIILLTVTFQVNKKIKMVTNISKSLSFFISRKIDSFQFQHIIQLNMCRKRQSYLLQRNRILSRSQRQRYGEDLKEDYSETNKGESFQTLFNFYVDLNTQKTGKNTQMEENREKKERRNAILNPYEFKYLAKVLLKIPEKSYQDSIIYKSVIVYFQHLYSKKLFSPQFSPQLLNNPQMLQEKIHNCESLNENDYFIRNLSLAYDTQLRSDEVPFLLVNESEFSKDIEDKENKLKEMICGLLNHGGGYMIVCEDFTKNRIAKGLKEITKVFIDNVKFKLETVLNTIFRNQDIGIEVQFKALKQIGDRDAEEEHVIFIKVKINPEKSSMGFYIDRKKYNLSLANKKNRY